MHHILKILPKDRQTMLFSATQTTKVSDLAKLSLRGIKIYIYTHPAQIASILNTTHTQTHFICMYNVHSILSPPVLSP